MDIAVIGNAPANAGFAVAGDLALAGHAVRYAPFPGEEETLSPVRRRGGLLVQGDPRQTVSGRVGLAQPLLFDSARDALRGAPLVFLDIEANKLEARFESILEHLEPGQVVHVNLHGYWPGMRLAPMLRAAGKAGVTLTESPAPTIAADYADGVVSVQWLRRKLPVAAFPANRRGAALPLLTSVYPTLVPVDTVMETGLTSLNMMIHAGMGLLNVGWFDRAAAAGETAHFYGPGNTPHTGRFSEVQDSEREPVCAAYGAPFRSLPQCLKDFYDARGATVHELVQGCDYYQALKPYPANVWQRWMANDVASAHVPFVALAELAGIAVPIHRSVITVFGALLGRDFFREGVTLERLGVAGKSVSQIKAYVLDGVS